jgi:hypothetical protein
MKVRLVLGAVIIFLYPSLACDSPRTYPVTFVCDSTADSACPPGAECPTLPLGTDSCGDLPGLFGHPATPVAIGRPVGCTVRLSYGNPYYGDSQQTCTCSTLGTSTSPPTPQWLCPI